MKFLILRSENLYTNFINYYDIENYYNDQLLYADNFNLKNNTIIILLKEKEIEIGSENIKFYKIFSAYGEYWIKNIDGFEEI